MVTRRPSPHADLIAYLGTDDLQALLAELADIEHVPIARRARTLAAWGRGAYPDQVAAFVGLETRAAYLALEGGLERLAAAVARAKRIPADLVFRTRAAAAMAPATARPARSPRRRPVDDTLRAQLDDPRVTTILRRLIDEVRSVRIKREAEALMLFIEGSSVAEIAARCHLSPHTLRDILSAGLGVFSRPKAKALLAIRHPDLLALCESMAQASGFVPQRGGTVPQPRGSSENIASPGKLRR